MRKLIVPIVLILLVAGYSAYWYQKAEDFKHTLEQSIVALNEQAKTLKPDNTLLTYESIHASGYPFGMTLVIQKPVIRIPASNIARAIMQRSAQMPVATTPVAPDKDWVEEVSYGGDIALSGNITGNKFTFSTSGDRLQKSIRNNVVAQSFITTSATPFTCHLAIENTKGAPWTMQPIFTDPQTFLAIFRSMDCDMAGLELKDAATSAILAKSDKFHVASSNEPHADGLRTLSFAMVSEKAIVLPAMDAIFTDFMQWAYDASGVTAKPVSMILPSQYGEQNVHIDIRYDGPTDAANITQNSRFSFDINAFNLKNALMDMELNAHAASAPQGDQRDASLTFHSKATVTEAYDQLLGNQFAAIFTAMQQPDAAGKVDSKMLQTMSQLGTPQEVAAAVLPNLHTLGPITLDINAKAKGTNQGTEMFSRGAYALDALDWTTSLYGIKLKGSADSTGKMPVGDLTINCLSCDALVTDMGNYAMRLEKLFMKVTPGQQAHVTPQLIDSIKQFLHGISQTPADKTAKDITIVIAMKNTGEFTVSGKQMMEVLGLFGTTVAPQMQPGGAMPAQPAVKAPATKTPTALAPITEAPAENPDLVAPKN